MEANCLTDAISEEDFANLPKDIAKKIEKYIKQRSQEFLCQKAICGNSEKQVKTKIDEIEALTKNLDDANVKIKSLEIDVKELTDQLDISKNESRHSIDTNQLIQNELNKIRHQYNEVVEDRNNMRYNIKNLTSNIDSLKLEIAVLHEQLNNTIRLKNEAILKYDGVRSQEESLIFKEQQYQRDVAILQAQNKTYQENMTKNLEEIQILCEKHTSDTLELTANYKIKTEELRIANDLNAEIMLANAELQDSVGKLNKKLKEARDDTTKTIECYKKELQARENLVDLQTETKIDYQKHINELNSTITELKAKLQDSSYYYGKLETNLKATEERLESSLQQRDTELNNLKDELKHSNELLQTSKDELLEYHISQISPTGALSTIMKKKRLTITDMYTRLVESNMSIIKKDREIKQLEIQLNAVVVKLEEKAPIPLNNEANEYQYQEALNENKQLKKQLDALMTTQHVDQTVYNNMKENYHILECRVEILNSAISDLKSQNMCLLKAQNMLRAGTNVDCDYESKRMLQNGKIDCNDSMGSVSLSEAPLSKQLINYSSVEELQENNQKLILIVRDLSSKLAEIDELRANTSDNKIVFYETRIKDLEETQQYQNKLMDACISQKEFLTDLRKQQIPNNINALIEDEQYMEIPIVKRNVQQQRPSTNHINNYNANIATINQQNYNDKQHYIELEIKIKTHVNQLKALKTEYDEYRIEQNKNEQKLIDQCQTMHNALRDLTSSNCKLTMAAEFNNEQLKTRENTVQILKKQIQSLEERNKMQDGVIVKYEECVKQLRNELLVVLKKLQDVELHKENLKVECKSLRDAESRVNIERDIIQHDLKSISSLFNSFDTIKLNLVRTQNDDLVKFKMRYDDATRELSTLRHHLLEEQDRHRKQILHYQRDCETAKDRLETELIQLDKHQNEINNLREEIRMKTEINNDLSKKLNDSLQAQNCDNPISKINKKIRDVQVKFDQCQTENETLRKQLTEMTQSVHKYCNMAQNLETDLTKLQEEYNEYRKKMEDDLKLANKNEADYKIRAVELENEYKLLLTDSKGNETDDTSQLSSVQNELKIALQKINENNRELRDLRDQCSVLSNLSQTMEKKYHDEMVSHSVDQQLLTVCKDELNKVKINNEIIKNSHKSVENELNALKETTQANLQKVQAEKTVLDERINNLIEQNAQLHLALDSLTVKITNKDTFDKNYTSAAANVTMDLSTSSNIDVNNRSSQEGDDQINVELFSIIKYLRNEKNIAFSQVDVLKSENIRLKNEIKFIQKKFEEFELQNNSNNSIDEEFAPVKSVVYDELLTKIEILNAITNSNHFLREERTTLAERVKELNARIELLENELIPLKEENRNLTSKYDEQQIKYSALRAEVELWRTRANALVERSNKNPEEFKRIINERESLAKMLNAERENIKLLNEEIVTLKNVKQRIENDLNYVNKLCKIIQEEKRKSDDEHDNLKTTHSWHTKELLDTKNNLYERECELKKTTEVLNTTNKSLLEFRYQLPQLRKIAKSYKDRYMTLKSEMDGRSADVTKTIKQQSEIDDQSVITIKYENEKLPSDKTNDLKAKIVSMQEECDCVRTENLALKARIENGEKITGHNKEIENQVNILNETNKQAHKELQLTKNQLNNCEQQNLNIADMKLQLETKITLLEKELNDRTKEIKELKEHIDKLNDENEALICMQRMSFQSGTKPDSNNLGTIEKSQSDPARTANTKLMDGSSCKQSPTVQSLNVGDTPLASIRSMCVQNSRTVVILPTSQINNNSNVQSSTTSNSCSVTSLKPNQQQVHTTSGIPGEGIASATGFAAVVLAAVPPMETSSSSTIFESSQDAENTPNNNNIINTVNESQNVTQSLQQQIRQQPDQQQQSQLSQQAVALMSLRLESGGGSFSDSLSQNMVVPQLQTVNTEQNITFSTSTTSALSIYTSTLSSMNRVNEMSTHHQASSSNTTPAGGHKRPHDTDSESSAGVEDTKSQSTDKTLPKIKRTRVSETFQGRFTASSVPYQVPRSTQRDQEDERLCVVHYDEDVNEKGMVDVGTAEVDDGQLGDDADNVMVVVEVCDSSEVLEQSGNTSSPATSQIGQSTETTGNTLSAPFVGDNEQIINTESLSSQQNNIQQTNSFGNGEAGMAGSSSQLTVTQISSSCRQTSPIENSRHQQQIQGNISEIKVVEAVQNANEISIFSLYDNFEIEGNIEEEKEGNVCVSSENNDVEVEEGRETEANLYRIVRAREPISTEQSAAQDNSGRRITPISWSVGNDVQGHDMPLPDEDNPPQMHEQTQGRRGKRKRRGSRRGSYKHL